jgi:hypothetical protein
MGGEHRGSPAEGWVLVQLRRMYNVVVGIERRGWDMSHRQEERRVVGLIVEVLNKLVDWKEG